MAQGDKIQIEIADVSDTQVSLKNGSWADMTGTGIENFSTPGDKDFYVSGAMVTELKSGGLVMSGKNYTIKKVSILDGVGSEGYDDAVWIGNKAVDSWGAWQIICAASFANVKEIGRAHV